MPLPMVSPKGVQDVKNTGLGAQSLSRVWLFATPHTVAFQAPLSIEKAQDTGPK